jgi:hypothetical protein
VAAPRGARGELLCHIDEHLRYREPRQEGKTENRKQACMGPWTGGSASPRFREHRMRQVPHASSATDTDLGMPHPSRQTDTMCAACTGYYSRYQYTHAKKMASILSVSNPALLNLLSFGDLAEVGRISMTCKHLAATIIEEEEVVFGNCLTRLQVGHIGCPSNRTFALLRIVSPVCTSLCNPFYSAAGTSADWAGCKGLDHQRAPEVLLTIPYTDCQGPDEVVLLDISCANRSDRRV